MLKKFLYNIIAVFICLNLILFNSLISYGVRDYAWTTIPDVVTTSDSEEEQLNTNNTNPLNLESESAVLIEQSSGKVLYNHNMHEKLRPASVTKVMSILLIMEAIEDGRISYDTQIPCSENAAGMGGSQIWLDTTETLSVNDMLKAICVVSANDCTVAMAEYLEGSEEAFVEKMNEKAKELNMNDTCFKNCHGIDEDDHLTSAYDIALMSRELLSKHPDIKNYTTIYMDSLRDGKSELVNTNKLTRTYKGITGLKTGSTSLALYNLSATATRDDLSLVAVIMRAPTTKIRFAEAQKLLDYGYSNYSCIKLGDKGEKIEEIEINRGIKDSVDGVLKEETCILIPKGKNNQIEQAITLSDNLIAPIKKDDKIGEIVYKLGEETLATIDIVASEDIDKISIGKMSIKTFKKWFYLNR